MTELTARDSTGIFAETLERRRERIFWYGGLALVLAWPFALHYSISPDEDGLHWQMPNGIQVFLGFLPGILLALVLEVFVSMLAGRRPRFWRKGLAVTTTDRVPVSLPECAGGILLRLQQQGFRAQASPDSRQIEFTKAKDSTVAGFASHAFSGQAELTAEGTETRIHIRLELHDIVIIETGESAKLQEMAARLCGVTMAPAARELPFLLMTGLADGVLNLSLTLVPYFRINGMTWLLALALGSVVVSVAGLVEIWRKPEQFFGLRLGVLGICLGLTPVAAMLSDGPLAYAADTAWDWSVATPESQGMSAPRLNAIHERLAAKKTKAFLVVRNDRIVHEWYAPGITATTKQGTASLAKALAGGLSLAVAITDRRISIDDPVAKYVPQWKDEPRKSKITIRHLGSHTSGLSDSTTEGVKHEEQPGWMGQFWQRLDPPGDPFTISRDEAPMLFAPGERLQYSNPGIGMMTYCVTAAIQGGEHKDIRTLLRDRVMRPIGVADGDWSMGYGKTFVVGGLPLVATWGGGAYTPRATARIGRLVLHEGNWEGRRILSPDSVRQVTGDAGLVGHCGTGWWSNRGQRYAKLPQDAVWGAGAGDQLLLVVPSLNLIMVRNGEALAPGAGEPPVETNDVFTLYHDYRARLLFEPLAEAVTNSSRGSRRAEIQPPPPTVGADPVLEPKSLLSRPSGTLSSAQSGGEGWGEEVPHMPRSSFIKAVRWAPAATIRRAAKGSDNWPLTWADDGALYGAYGDGNGFEPQVSTCLAGAPRI